MHFFDRVSALPHLGVGVSTEFGASGQANSLNIANLLSQYPKYACFLEVGIETTKGLDGLARWWAAQGLPTTYHFLDVNLDDPDDFGADWLAAVKECCAILRPAWLCGDAGLWHFGPRDRNHMLLLPPILTADAAKAMAEGIVRLREETGYEVFPENPPGSVFVGNLHILEFFSLLCEYADTGMLLDCAHLAIYQAAMGHPITTGFDNFDWNRVVEVHVAGSAAREFDGLTYLEDDHSPNVLPETWTCFRNACEQATELRAAVFECERNAGPATIPGFAQITRMIAQHQRFRGGLSAGSGSNGRP